MTDKNTTEHFAGKRILVTGGAGFIGCAIAELLAASAARYVVMDNLHPQVHKTQTRPEALHKRAELVVGDVTVPTDWDALLAEFQPEVVVHLAAETGTGQSLTEASRHGLVNVVGTTQMTDAFGRHKVNVEHVLLTSSRAVYGEGAWQSKDGQITYPGQRGRTQLEAAAWDFPGATSLPSSVATTVPHPTSVYGATKLAQEHILAAWALSMKVPLSILRLQNVYGPGQSLTNSYTGIVALFSRLARAGKFIPLYEDGEVTRDFVCIRDVASAIVAALATPPAAHQYFDVGSGVATSILTLANLIAAYYGAPAPQVNGLFRDGDVRHAACDLSSTLASLRWKPQVTLEAGLADLQDWIASEETKQA
ncbi:NAD(P)-dependent oxidoreductase [Caballeronia sp. GAWG2-1]|uniref:NAD-dependent epimerase/dehydratase family protein n=1 Tax=Caballeronia sp. GAWG2-1 TaxID=2921744 RepID=UPI002028347C|nr:NAD(P)-dependent oxidoreductase [Caballeronia sp. GAWG2-1]